MSVLTLLTATFTGLFFCFLPGLALSYFWVENRCSFFFFFFFYKFWTSVGRTAVKRNKTKQNEKQKKKPTTEEFRFVLGSLFFFLGYFVRLFHFSLAALIFLALLHAVPCGGPSESILPSFTEFFFLIRLSFKIFSLLQIETAIGWRPIEFYEQPGS